MVRIASAVCVILAASIVCGRATAQAERASDEREARGLFDLGSEAYAQARYDRALKYFEEAYALSKRPGLLYNLGLTYSNLRRDREAIDAFERYLAEVPDADNREAVQNRLTILKRNVEPSTPAPGAAAAQPAPAVVPTPEQTARAQVATNAAGAPPPPAEEPRSDESSGGVHQKWWFWAGIGGAVVAGVLIGVAASGGGRTVEDPALLDDMTRVREL